ncbi:MAG TPA: hypothetical protein VIU86_19975 [Gaiellaceae bacterium]
MSDWLSFRAAVVAAIEAALPASVLPTTGVAWADGPRPHARQLVLLSVVSTLFDDRDSALSEGGLQTLESMATPTVQVSCESSFDSGDADALWLIEQCRLGLRKVSVREALASAGIVIQVFPRSTRNVGGQADDRALSVHLFEVRFCTTFVLVPDPAEDAGLIESVDIAATFTDDQGTDFEIDLTVDDPDPEE